MSRLGGPQFEPSPKQSATIGNVDDTAVVPYGIDAEGCRLSSFPDTFLRMTNLTHIYLAHNNISAIPDALMQLTELQVLDLSYNNIREIPHSIFRLKNIVELLLSNNGIESIPHEMGKLYKLKFLDLLDNPLNTETINGYRQPLDDFLGTHLDALPLPPKPGDREWIYPVSVDVKAEKVSARKITVFCYNILCDRYTSRQQYKYCPSWALRWKHRSRQILNEILERSTDIICLQEVDGAQFYTFFEPELNQRGYSGIFKPKSRAATHGVDGTDGCAIFFFSNKYRLLKEHLIQFSSESGRHYNNCAAMIDRVMSKDNIALLAVLESVEHPGKKVVVCNLHLTWDPQFKDVKVIQTMLALNAMQEFMKENKLMDLPVLLTGDFNSLPDSGVYEFLSTQKISLDNPDLEGYDFEAALLGLGLEHPFKLRSAYTTELPYTNYTIGFTGIIDYIWYTQHLVPTALLGPVNEAEMEVLDGCPNAYFPSDHISLCAEFAFR
eukprot:m.358289 g.358289  ORF g.358289 m.358289 type:complete len:495 (-) comp18103_c0_seq1:768-2252(-)